MLNILVCVKQVPDINLVKMDPVTGSLIRAGVPAILNPLDANALEAAVRVKEAHGGTVTVITMGPDMAKEALRECLAAGADRAVLLSDRAFANADTLATSYVIASAAKQLGDFDLIFCGKESLDGATGQMGSQLAERFGGDFDLVVCHGGDGTLNETINGLMSAGVSVPIGYLPMGSTNDLAATLGIPTKLKEAAELIASGHTNGYDVGDYNGHQFSYVACFGPGTKISYSTPQKMKNLLGYNAYMINGFFLHLIPALADVKPRHIKIEYDGNVLEDDFYFGSFSNSTSVAGLFKFDKNDIKLDDGKFELLLVRKLSSPLAAFGMLHRIMKRDFDGDSLIFIKASEVKFTFEKPEEWTLDGECGGSTTQVDLKVLNRAVSIFSPENPMFSFKEEKEEATV